MTIPATAPAPVKPDYINELLQDATYEIIRRSGVYKSLENHEWDSQSVALAAELRPVIDKYLAAHSE